MPTRGLSLVGMFDREQQALHHLRMACVFPDASDAALLKEWHAAKSKLGAPIVRAGTPDVRPIPPADDAYIRELRSQRWVQTAFKISGFEKAEFKLVEIEPLLARQYFVDIERSNHIYGDMKNPTVANLLPICLPRIQPKPLDHSPAIDMQDQSVTIKSRQLSVQPLTGGMIAFNQDGYHSIVAGLRIHVSTPFVHVVRFDGKYILRNGYHRTFGAAKAGATHIPCLFREVTNPTDALIGPDEMPWLTFPLRLMESSNPPALGHFVQGRAHEVRLRAQSRVMTVSWSVSVMPDEFEGMKSARDI